MALDISWFPLISLLTRWEISENMLNISLPCFFYLKIEEIKRKPYYKILKSKYFKIPNLCVLIGGDIGRKNLTLNPFIVVQGGPCGLQNNISYCYWSCLYTRTRGYKTLLLMTSHTSVTGHREINWTQAGSILPVGQFL